MIKNLGNNLKKKKKGFTLIELIIVIAIIGILAVIAVPKFGGIQQDAKKKSDIATAKNIADVTTMLVTQGGITGDYSAAAALGSDITGKLQGGTSPTPKAKSGTFKVQIDGNKNVTVFVDSTQIYPDSSGY